MGIFVAGPSGGELLVSLEGRDITIRPGQTARIGRAPENDLVTNAPTVSRQHAVLHWGAEGWEFENVGAATTFCNGQQVTRVVVDRPLDLAIGSAEGPPVHVEPTRPAASPAAAQSPAAQAPGAAPPPGGAGYEPSPWSAGYLPPPGPAGNQGPPGAGWGPAPPQAPVTPGGGLTSEEMSTALRILFPIHSWLHDAGWRQWLRVLVIVYALLPLLFLALLSSSNDLSAPGWAYSLYIAPL